MTGNIQLAIHAILSRTESKTEGPISHGRVLQVFVSPVFHMHMKQVSHENENRVTREKGGGAGEVDVEDQTGARDRHVGVCIRDARSDY